LELEEGRTLGGYTNGILYVGDKGKMMMSGAGSNPVIIPEAAMNAYRKPAKTLWRSPGHYQEWIDACKGGRPAGSNFDHAGPLAEAVLLGNIALRRPLREKLATKRLLWDAKNLKFTNAPEANQYIRKEYREGYSL
jgi:hypothetical protein